MDPSRFYDDIAEYYDLIYDDWEASMRRQGSFLAAMLGGPRASPARVLDVSAGIGTQALPLAAAGYDVVARDLSSGAVRRLQREAVRRGLDIDAAPADMRSVADTVVGPFDAVLSMDNSVPHLLTDSDILTAFRGFRSLLSAEGVVLISVRDYAAVDRSPRSTHPYGVRTRSGRRFRSSQEWVWYDDAHYRTTMRVETEVEGGWREVVRTEAAYYAVSIARILDLMAEAGFEAARVTEPGFFQPVLRGEVRVR